MPWRGWALENLASRSRLCMFLWQSDTVLEVSFSSLLHKLLDFALPEALLPEGAVVFFLAPEKLA